VRIGDLPPIDVREVLVEQRRNLVGFLEALNPDQWAAQTAAPDWSVKDVTLHLLDDDLRWLTYGRDRDRSAIIDVPADHETFVRALAEHNQRWISGTRVLSPRLIVDLLRWSGEELTPYLDSVDLRAPSSVYWAGDVPLWFDLAREFTERWVHERQIREAVLGGRDHAGDEYLGLVIGTFVWAFPHQYAAEAQSGTVVVVDVGGVRTWRLTRNGEGWILHEGDAPAPAATLRMTGDASWRLLTGARYDLSQVELFGDRELAEALTGVRSIIV
jgi:uncharacterized protein (TIGR03083 family)